MCRKGLSTSGLIMMPRVTFNFDSLMMALFDNVQRLGRSRCIPSHFSRRKFQTFSEEHALGTPLDDLHFRDRFSPLHPPPPTLKYPREGPDKLLLVLLVCTCDHFDQARLAQLFHPTQVDAFRARLIITSPARLDNV